MGVAQCVSVHVCVLCLKRCKVSIFFPLKMNILFKNYLYFDVQELCVSTFHILGIYDTIKQDASCEQLEHTKGMFSLCCFWMIVHQ